MTVIVLANSSKMAALTAKSAVIGAAAKNAAAGAFVRASAPLSTSAPALGPPERRPKMADVEGSASLAKMKKGPGYRSSFSGNVATVFGAGGMVGRSVMNRFGRNGTQIIVPYRGEFYWLQRLKVVGDLGQVLFSPFDLRDEESIRYVHYYIPNHIRVILITFLVTCSRSMRHSNVVVNLIGKQYQTYNFKFSDVNVDGARRIARIAREEGVDRLVHISAMNAKEKPDVRVLENFRNPSSMIVGHLTLQETLHSQRI